MSSTVTRPLLLLITAALCVLGSAVAAFFALRETPAPTLRAEPEVWDFGEMRQEEQRTATFLLRNASGSIVTISAVQQTCGCTAGSPQHSVLHPAEETQMDVTLFSGRAEGVLAATTLVLYHRSGQDGLYGLPLRVRASIDREFDIVPSTLRFDASSPHTQWIHISSRHVNPLHIAATSTRAFFATSVLVDEHTGGFRVQVEFDPERYHRDAGRAELLVRTNSERVPSLRIPLMVALEPPQRE